MWLGLCVSCVKEKRKGGSNTQCGGTLAIESLSRTLENMVYTAAKKLGVWQGEFTLRLSQATPRSEVTNCGPTSVPR
jgi:hypothetical protein